MSGAPAQTSWKPRTCTNHIFITTRKIYIHVLLFNTQHLHGKALVVWLELNLKVQHEPLLSTKGDPVHERSVPTVCSDCESTFTYSLNFALLLIK